MLTSLFQISFFKIDGLYPCMKRIVFGVSLGGILLVVALFLNFSWLKSIPNFPGVQVHAKPIEITPFLLQDHNGNPFGVQNLKGRWTLAFFGYTHCPDVCPTTLSVINDVATELKNDPKTELPQLVFISVDPYRDSGQVLHKYVSFFNQELVGLTGDASNLQKLTSQIGVIYDYEDSNNGKLYRNVERRPETQDYSVNHYASIFLFDPKARLVADILPPHDKIRVIQVFRKIREYFYE